MVYPLLVVGVVYIEILLIIARKVKQMVVLVEVQAELLVVQTLVKVFLVKETMVVVAEVAVMKDRPLVTQVAVVEKVLLVVLVVLHNFSTLAV